MAHLMKEETYMSCRMNNIFDEFAEEYDAWFDGHRWAYESEILALRQIMLSGGIGLEIGVGTGRFAASLDIAVGIEPARRMGAIAKDRGIDVVEACAEYLPFRNASFDFALLVTTLCFVRDPLASLQEARRVIRPGGRLIIGMIDSESPLGRTYESKRYKSKFYRNAVFLSIGQVVAWLEELDFYDIRINQTIFGKPDNMIKADPVKEGHGEGQFAGIRATRGS